AHAMTERKEKEMTDEELDKLEALRATQDNILDALEITSEWENPDYGWTDYEHTIFLALRELKRALAACQAELAAAKERANEAAQLCSREQEHKHEAIDMYEAERTARKRYNELFQGECAKHDLTVKRARDAEADLAAAKKHNEKMSKLATPADFTIEENKRLRAELAAVKEKKRPFSNELTQQVVDCQVKEIDRLTKLIQAERTAREGAERKLSAYAPHEYYAKQREDFIRKQTDDHNLLAATEHDRLCEQQRATAAEARCVELQARLDAVMLEYCSDDMTEEQVLRWQASQRPATVDETQAIDEALAGRGKS
ncbi:MAG: hypothetical protein ACTS6J_02180, partial [Burkholderiales bacterium]